MMHILEALVQKEKYSYLRMDGTTPMSQRQVLISRFNKVGFLSITLHIIQYLSIQIATYYIVVSLG
jgi:SNF2 family DNA or RNA helicase